MKTTLFTYLIVALFIYSCKKAGINSSQNLTAPNLSLSENELIREAQKYYNTIPADANQAGDQNKLMRISKQPLWDNAFTVKGTNQEDIVVVPLHYEKAISGKANFATRQPISYEANSTVWITRDETNQFSAEMVVSIPDAAYKGAEFSGLVFRNSLTDNKSSASRYLRGAIKSQKSSFASQPVNSTNAKLPPGDCVAIDWYECDQIDNGVGTNCIFQYTQFFCNDGGGGEDDPGGDGNPGTGNPGGGCDPVVLAQAQQNFNNETKWTPDLSSVSLNVTNNGDTTFATKEIILGEGGLFNTWSIRAMIEMRYVHNRYMLTNTLTYQDEYNILYYKATDGYYIGSNTLITTTYSSVSPTSSFVNDNNSPSAHGFSHWMGKLAHESTYEVPFCKTKLKSEGSLDVSKAIYPR